MKTRYLQRPVLPFPAFLSFPTMAPDDPPADGGGAGGAGAGGGGAGDGGAGGGAAQTSPFDTLRDENKTYHAAKQYKTVDDVFDALRNAESFVGLDKQQLLRLPADRTPENMRDVFKQLGRPDDVAGYGLKEDAELGLAGPQFEAFQKTAHDLDLLPYQVQGLIEKFYGPMAKSLGEQTVTQKQESLAAGEKAARELFGAADDTPVEEIPEIKAINAMLEEHGDGELDEYLFKSGRGNDPALMKFMGKIAKLVGEPSSLPGEKGRDTTISGKLTPAAAEAKLGEFERANEAALRDKAHPDHRELTKQREELLRLAYPDPKRKAG